MGWMQLAIVFIPINVLPALVFVFHITRGNRFFGMIDKLILAVILSPLVLVLVSFTEEFIGIPQSLPVLLFNLVALAGVNTYMLIRFFPDRENYAFRMTWSKVFIYALFVILVILRVGPTLDLFTPLLHDPIAHSEWLKHLNTDHFTTTQQWYPQGLEYYLNYFVTFVSGSFPEFVLHNLNYNIALYSISMFYLGLLAFHKEKYWWIGPLIIFVFSALLAQPFEFYFIGGKNSMVFAFTVIPILLYMMTNMKNTLDYVATTFFTFSLVLVHYPMGLIMLFILYFARIGDIVRFRERRLTLEHKTLGDYLTVSGLALFISILLMVQLLPRYLDRPLSGDTTAGIQFDYIENYGMASYLLHEFINERVNTLGIYPLILLAVTVLVFPFLPNDGKQLPRRLLLSFVALYALGIVLLLHPDKTYGVFFNTEMRHFLVPVVVICVSWSVSRLLHLTILKIPGSIVAAAIIGLLLGSLFLYRGLDQYRTYISSQQVIETTSEEDLAAFDYINEEILDDRKLLIQMGRPNDIDSVVAGADSGVWIPSFTDKLVEVSYLEFSSTRTADIFDLYIDLADGEARMESIKELYCGYYVGYIFFGSRPVYFNSIQREMLDKSELLERIYDRGATIYRIKPTTCEVSLS